MKNWTVIPSGNWVNLDYVTQIYVHKIEEKWFVIGDIAGKEAAFILSEAFEEQEGAKEWLQSIRWFQ